ncbi:hypothetical protein [Hyalangium versicolor]|uniref:hypothetical protein n=1 Tax=Hyalangium versicolor TaxID=2861190 RepID=UPI001CCF3D0B|nr:hypothetical protein [Hyalangium versicolor]
MKNVLLSAVCVWVVACGPADQGVSSGLPETEPGAEASKPLPGVASPPLEGLGAELPEKRALGTVNAAAAWSVGLNKTSPAGVPWLTQNVTLTATANQDVSSTPYYIRIRDAWGGPIIANCGTGTTCSANVVSTWYHVHQYQASIEDYSGNTIMATAVYYVDWDYVFTDLSVASSTVGLGASTTVSASVTRDLATGPLYLDIYDVTAGTRIKSCGTGYTCTATVSQAAAGTHTYKAFLTSSNDGSVYPPANNFGETAVRYVTWTGTGYTISLSAPETSCENCFVTVTATTNINVGPTAYYITLFNMNGTWLKTCGTGTSCSVQFQPNGTEELVAFISSNNSTLLPTNIQATSNVVEITELIPPH